MPWEILHTDQVLKNSRRTVRFITKGGGLPGYFSIIATIPEFDLGFTVLVAGEYEMLPKLRNAIGETIVRAAEEVSIRQLQERYVGIYSSNNKTLNSNDISALVCTDGAYATLQRRGTSTGRIMAHGSLR
jgi:hypothetical protein